MVKKLGKKQQCSNSDFVSVWRNIDRHISRQEVENVVDKTVYEVKKILGNFSRPAFGWSGGKDSQALLGIMRLCGIEGCLMGMSNLEYPAFLQWVTDYMPDDLEIFNNQSLDLEWLVKNPSMLFPSSAEIAGKWFKLVQHRAQKQYCKKHNTDILVLGRRRIDGNFMGRGGTGLYYNADKNLVYCPVRDWSHEEVLGFCYYFDYPLPPTYSWVNGFVVGTGAWPARQYTKSPLHGWKEVYSIDPSVVQMASTFFPDARKVLETVNCL